MGNETKKQKAALTAGPKGIVQIWVGSTWRELNSRSFRLVQVVDTENSGFGKVTLRNLATNRRTKASVERFTGKPNGYMEVRFPE